MSALLYAMVVGLSWRFEGVDASLGIGEKDALLRQRPIVAVLVCFGALFGLYLASLRIAVRRGANRNLVPAIFGFAVAFRLLLLASHPIQEVDIYRYLWDGAVVRAGVSPFRYSPEQVLGGADNESQPADFRRLLALRDSSPAVRQILERVHFGQLPTVYPPVSQAVFAAAAWTTPTTASVRTRIVIMRCWLLAFDLATAWLLLLILRHVGQPDGWVLAYAWCPLVMKEFANSGHLDSIAVCLTTGAMYLALRAFYPGDRDGSRVNRWLPAFAAALLALGVGAKLYPLVLAPLLLAGCVRRLGWKSAATPAATFLVLGVLVCAPLISRPGTPVETLSSHQLDDEVGLEAPQPDEFPVTAQKPGRGLSAFLRQWEMNDFLFLLLVENLEPDADQPASRRAWFTIAPTEWRDQLAIEASTRFDADAGEAAFLLARFVTGGLFLLLALRWSWPAAGETDRRFLECAFLTLAWFWLLLPTQNPWYWIWAMPLIPFARSRAWLAMSGCVLAYYLRFWLVYHWPETPVAGSRYAGAAYFDFVVSWVEYGPWFVWLGVEGWWRGWTAERG